MKKIYNEPEFEIMIFSLSNNLLVNSDEFDIGDADGSGDGWDIGDDLDLDNG